MKQERKRLFIDIKTSAREREKLINLAVENGCNTVVFSLKDPFFKSKSSKCLKLTKRYALNIEAGGRDLPLLLPKRLFLFQPGLFRMEHGRRKMDRHFCPTNPKTISIIAQRAHFFISRAMEKMDAPRIFHLLPEEGHENTWCQCPACRAFRPAEQYLIAVNTAADVLAQFDSGAQLVYIDFDREPDAARVKPRDNLLVIG